MIHSKLKRRFIEKKIAKLSTDFTGNKELKEGSFSTVGIITTEDVFQKYDLQEWVSERLNLRNPKIYSYRKYRKEDEQSYKHFTEKDFNWKGEITDSSLKSFLDQPFDLLLCLFDKRHPLLKYCVVRSKSTFRIGLKGVYSEFYDIEIAIQAHQIDVFFEEAKRYLTILEKL